MTTGVGASPVEWKLVDIRDGSDMTDLLKMTSWVLTWGEQLSGIQGAELSMSVTSGCPPILKPGCYRLEIYRGDRRCHCYIFEDLISNDNSFLLTFRSAADILMSRVWEETFGFNGTAGDGFRAGLESLNRNATLEGVEVVYAGGGDWGVDYNDFGSLPGVTLFNLLAAMGLTWTEYADDNVCHKIVYGTAGELGADRGYRLNRSDFVESPEFGYSGDLTASKVIVRDPVSSGEAPTVVASYPPEENIVRDCSFRQKVFVFEGLSTVGDAAEIARNIWRVSQSPFFLGANDQVDSGFSKNFDIDLCDVHAGDLFMLEEGFLCFTPAGRVRLTSLDFTASNGIESTVRAQFDFVV